MRRTNRRLGRAGFTLLEIMIGAALLSFVVVAALSVDNISKQADSRLNLVRSVEIIRQNFIDVLTTPEAFYNTIQQSAAVAVRTGVASTSTMACVFNSVKTPQGSPLCAPATDFNGEKEPPFAAVAPGPTYDTLKFWNYNWGLRPLKIYRADNTPFYDSTNPKSGFALDGTPCLDFDDGTDIGHSDCPLHYEFSWTIECSPTACNCPTIIVGARVIYHPGTVGSGGLNYTAIHPQQHGITTLRISLDSFCGGG